jgi:hypothetical protein
MEPAMSFHSAPVVFRAGEVDGEPVVNVLFEDGTVIVFPIDQAEEFAKTLHSAAQKARLRHCAQAERN